MSGQIATVFEYIFLGAFRYYSRRLHESPYAAALGGGGIVVELVSANLVSIVALTAQRGSDRYSEQLINVIVRFGPWPLVSLMVLATYVIGTRLGAAGRRNQIEAKIKALSKSERSRVRLA